LLHCNGKRQLGLASELMWESLPLSAQSDRHMLPVRFATDQ
jgi:hypothetical protein